MNCNEFLEHISAVIDGETDKTQETALKEHLRQCDRCRNEYELEHITKNVVKQTLKCTQAPQPLRARIALRLSDEYPQQPGKQGWLSAIMHAPKWKTALALTGALAILLLIVQLPLQFRHSHAQPQDDNFIHQTYNNFDRALKDQIPLEETSNDPKIVKAYLGTKTNFDVNVPPLKRCKLLGGALSDYKSIRLAHVIYQNNHDKIYIYQTKLSAVIEGNALALPPNVKEELLRTGKYFENHLPECTLVMWIQDSTVCCAVADLSRDELVAYLTDVQTAP